MPITPSGRWMVSIPFTNRILCRSFRGEWYLFKDVWDLGRHLKEASVVLMIVLSLSSVLTRQSVPFKPIAIKKVIKLGENGASFHERQIKQTREPFIDQETVYICR
jgi:hypothetical protein